MEDIGSIFIKLGYSEIYKFHNKIPTIPVGTGLRLHYNKDYFAEMFTHLKRDDTRLVLVEHYLIFESNTEGDEDVLQNEPCNEGISCDCSSLRDRLETEEEEV